MKFKTPIYLCFVAFILGGLALPALAYETLETSLDEDEPVKNQSNKESNKLKEKPTSKNLKSNGYLFADGHLLKRRQALHKTILQAKASGVGIAPYMVHLELIEDRVKDGESAGAIAKHINKVEKGLAKQFSLAPILPKGEKKISNYMVKLEKLVKENFKISSQDHRCKLNFQIDETGKIINIKPDKDNIASPTVQKIVSTELLKLNPLDPPPIKNMPVYFGVSKEGTNPLIAYYGKVDYGPFMQYIQWKIKKNWYPPKSNFTKKLTVFYTVKRSGEVCKIRLEKPSGYKECDAAAINALKTSSPFPELPDGAYPSVTVSFDFDYNVWKSGNLVRSR